MRIFLYSSADLAAMTAKSRQCRYHVGKTLRVTEYMDPDSHFFALMGAFNGDYIYITLHDFPC